VIWASAIWAIEEKDHSQRRIRGLIGLEPETCRCTPTRNGDTIVQVRLRNFYGEYGRLR